MLCAGDRAQRAHEQQRAQRIDPADVIVAEDIQIHFFDGVARLVVQLAIARDEIAAVQHGRVRHKGGHDPTGNVIRQQGGLCQPRVIRVAGVAVLDGPVAAGHVVVDAVGAHFALNAGIIQAARLQFAGDEALFLRAVDHQFAVVKRTVAAAIKHGQHVGGI